MRHINAVNKEVDEITDDMIANTSERYERSDQLKEKANAGLEWWGDIVRVVVIVVMILAGVTLLATSVGVQIIKGKGMLF